MNESATQDKIIALAKEINRRRCETPAIFFLEMSKPLVGCFRELYHCSIPLQTALCGKELAPVLSEVLSSSETVERLIVILEQLRDDSIEYQEVLP
jgi:hypothetical protein